MLVRGLSEELPASKCSGQPGEGHPVKGERIGLEEFVGLLEH